MSWNGYSTNSAEISRTDSRVASGRGGGVIGTLFRVFAAGLKPVRGLGGIGLLSGGADGTSRVVTHVTDVTQDSRKSRLRARED